ncbi:MAG: hypothetical protein GXP19_06040 [Gammaproteobacteria bacterium]|nr:hypothetical protein [Gammaproteobacteria bacterium]
MENFGSWSVLTTNFLIVLFMALAGVTFSAILHLVNGKWRFQVRYIACSLAALFPVAFVLLLILLINGESTFQWLATAHEGDQHLPGWHNYTFLVARQIIGFLLVFGMFLLFIKLQYQTSIDSSPAAHRKFRNIALLIPGVYVMYGTMIAWDFEMTMMPSWHSASYGVYHFVSNFHCFLAFFTLLLFFLHRSGKLKNPFKPFVFNYMAQFMLAFTILWTYFYFTQYLIMWYGRLPEEFDRFNQMMQFDLAPIWWTFLALKFIIPFVTFAVYTPNRHNPIVIIMVASCIVVGTWLERFTWISGSIITEQYHIPMTAAFDFIVTAIVLAASWFAVKWSLNKYGLVKAS